MNREIKFRVWDIKNKSFKLPSDEKIDGTMFVLSKDGHLFSSVDDDNYVYQQYTGINDKNGKEIYEGDIVKVRGYDDWNDDVGFDVVYEVKWSKIHVGWRGFTKKMGEESAGSGMPNPIEIIGNIFENPELLK